HRIEVLRRSDRTADPQNQSPNAWQPIDYPGVAGFEDGHRYDRFATQCGNIGMPMVTAVLLQNIVQRENQQSTNNPVVAIRIHRIPDVSSTEIDDAAPQPYVADVVYDQGNNRGNDDQLSPPLFVPRTIQRMSARSIPYPAQESEGNNSNDGERSQAAEPATETALTDAASTGTASTGETPTGTAREENQ
ncbi:MAG: hypothetical protein AAFP69_17385, partial [Planctomycetota bacterium]